MSEVLIPAVAAAQVTVIEASLTRPAPGDPEPGPGPDGSSWLGMWTQAVDLLHRLGRGSRHRCAGLVWAQIDLAADLRDQPWWADPRLRRAAVGQIAWTTTLGRWPGSVPTAEAQHLWETSHRMSGVIRHRLAVMSLHHHLRRGRLAHLADLRRGWEDAWWAWAALHTLDDHPATAAAAVRSGHRGPGATGAGSSGATAEPVSEGSR